MNLPAELSILPASRRSFLRKAITGGTAAALLPSFFTDKAQAAPKIDASTTDLDVLNFALHLEYLEAQYYSLAVNGVTLEESGVDTSGTGTHGTVTVKANSKVTFSSATTAGAAAEIAQDERNHVIYLRQAIAASGATPAAMPNVDLLNSFNTLAQVATIGDSFDPFVDDTSFLLGAFIFEDVGVTAYRGGSTKISNRSYLKAAAGILAVEALHAGEVRAMLFATGGDAVATAEKISNLRDALDGVSDHDQPLTDANGSANIVPTNGDGLVFSRNTRRVLNIVFGAVNATSGGFFPNGVNLAL